MTVSFKNSSLSSRARSEAVTSTAPSLSLSPGGGYTHLRPWRELKEGGIGGRVKTKDIDLNDGEKYSIQFNRLYTI